MKRILFFLFIAVSVSAFGQKQQKPNINKALKAWQDGKVAEAKDIIDAATTYEKTMNDGKTWYYRGLIYASIDTTSDETVKALASDAYNVALQSFAKSDELGKKGTEYFVQAPGSIVPITKTQQLEGLSNYYLDKGIRKYQDDQDLTASLEALAKSRTLFEKQLATYANDTLTYFVQALVAQQADSTERALEASRKYLDKGGKNKDVVIIMYQIYTTPPTEDKEKALEVAREGKKMFPDYSEFAKLEIGLLIDLNRIEEAKTGLQAAIEKEPGNKILHYYLGYISEKVNDVEGARKSYQNALKADPEYFDAQVALANTYINPIVVTSKAVNDEKDAKKRQALFQQRVRESEAAIPYLEKAEKMKAPDTEAQIEVLQKLAQLYYYVADDKNSDRVAKKLKALGAED